MSSLKNRSFHRFAHRINLKLPKPEFWWLFLVVYTLSLWFIFFGPLLRLKSISCSECPDFIVPELAKHQGKLIYLLDLPTLATRLKTNLPHANQIELKPVWPNNLQVKIYWQPAVANLTVPFSENVIILGENGQILDTLPKANPDLPIVVASVAAELIISDTINDPTLLTVLEIIQRLPQIIATKLSFIEAVSPLQIKVIDQNDKKYLFTSTKPIDLQLHALQLIRSQTTMNSAVQVIDLRYDRPALKSSW